MLITRRDSSEYNLSVILAKKNSFYSIKNAQSLEELMESKFQFGFAHINIKLHGQLRTLNNEGIAVYYNLENN